VTYYAAGETLDPEDAEATGFDFSEDVEFRVHPSLRRVVTTLVRPSPRFYGVLHWSDGTDLNLLDEKVQSGQPGDADFPGALLAEPRTVICSSCHAQVRVLAVDPGQTLFASTLAQRLRSHTFKRSCPVCGEPLGMLVVEFIGE